MWVCVHVVGQRQFLSIIPQACSETFIHFVRARARMLWRVYRVGDNLPWLAFYHVSSGGSDSGCQA